MDIFPCFVESASENVKKTQIYLVVSEIVLYLCIVDSIDCIK